MIERNALRSLREYLREVRHAYYSFVFGGVLAIAGAVGVFVSNQRWIKLASLGTRSRT